MITRDEVKDEINKVPDKFLQELYDFILYLKYRKYQQEDSVMTHVASEDALKDWNSTEEEQAWKNL
ncbi:MAG TPA: hypothetical protein PLV21_04520 [Cyclobacteriaceae bacterium]|nr:hypothetical protein [Cyclobacteriaceae bacterium]HRJ81124.1 hypothetical protein [Cyclobacteriaceae bacterium]